MPRPLKHLARLSLASALCLIAAGCGGSKVTKANADRITAGMTEKAVTDILGPPTTSSEAAVPLPGVLGGELPGGLKIPQQSKQSVWKDGNQSIVVIFMDGKVLMSDFVQDAALKSAAPQRGLSEEPFVQKGTFQVIADQESMVNFPIPYALPPNVEFSGSDMNCVVLVDTKATGFKWKGVQKPSYSGTITWTAKGVKATRLPEN